MTEPEEIPKPANDVQEDSESAPSSAEVDVADEADAVVKEQEETDYLSAALLDAITTVTPEQLASMEQSEQVRRDPELEKIVQSSVGEIREDKVVQGRVIGANDREVLVDIGFKSEGIVPREEFGPDEIPQIGDEITVYLVRMEDVNGQTVLSKEKAVFMQQWTEVREKTKSGETITGRIMRRIKGGMVVDLGGVPAFLPGSQIDIRPVQDFDEYIGQEFEFKIVKLNEARKNIVLSRKELLEADLQERRASLIAELHVGKVLEGRVKNITDFGVFVDLGGLDGLLHITDLSWGRVNHPSDVVELDEAITVKVIDFDTERQRVSLGLKQLQPHPWDSVELKYPVESTVEGKVVSMTNYGVFVEIEKGVEGLVHVSEMSWTKHIRHPSEMFTLGQIIEARILNVDITDRKISLGVKQLQPDPWDQIEEKYQVGSILQGTVRNLTQFGAFVELEEGVDGLIHITDLSWTVNVRHPREILNKNDIIQVRVLDVSRENRRIALGLKQVTDDPWEGIQAHFTSGKQVSGDVIRVLEKGIIVKLEMGMEGIISLKELSQEDHQYATQKIQPGDTVKGTVQELSADDKKVILITDDLASQVAPGEATPPVEAAADEPAPESRPITVASEAADSGIDGAAQAEDVKLEEVAPKKKAAPKKKQAASSNVEATSDRDDLDDEEVSVVEGGAKPKTSAKAAKKKVAAVPKATAKATKAVAKTKGTTKAATSKPKKSKAATKSDQPSSAKTKQDKPAKKAAGGD